MGYEDKVLGVYCLLVVLGVAILSLLGVHQSSLGIATLQDDGRTSEDVIAGTPREIRSDEYLRNSTLALGQEVAESGDVTTPLGADPTLTSSSPNAGFVEHLVLMDRTLLQLSPFSSDITFAAYWWLWIGVALVALPLLLRLWGLPLGVNALVTAAIMVNPAMFWWSFIPATPIALSAVVAVLIAALGRIDKRWFWLACAATAVIGGLTLARLPLGYFPWALPIAATLIVPTVVAGLVDSDRRRATIIGSTLVVIVGAGLDLLLVAQNSDAVRALLETEYPGARRGGGVLQNIGVIFGAPFLGMLQDNPSLVGTNQSEVTTAWAISGVAALLLLATARRVNHGNDRWLMLTLAPICTLGFAWVLFTWPPFASHIPFLNLIPASRMNGILGIPSALLFGLALSRVWRASTEDEPSARRWPLTIAVGLTLLMAGTYMSQTVLPELKVWPIFLISAFVAMVFVLLVDGRQWVRIAAVALAVVGMAATVYRVNPIMDGLGDIRNGDTATAIASVNASLSPQDPYWAADGLWANALLVANGVKTISADQWTGPSEQWLILDPSGEYREQWNRGASIIVFDWNPDQQKPIISNPVQDRIVIEVSPCSPALAELGVGAILSAEELSAACLTDAKEVLVGGNRHFIYRVQQ